MEYGTEWCLFCMTGGEEAAFDRARCVIADTAARSQSILLPETGVRRGGSGGYPESGRSPHGIAARRNPTEWEPRRTFEHKNRKDI